MSNRSDAMRVAIELHPVEPFFTTETWRILAGASLCAGSSQEHKGSSPGWVQGRNWRRGHPVLPLMVVKSITIDLPRRYECD